jgi:hypothetical protein
LGKDFTDYLAFETPDDLFFGLAFFGALAVICVSWCVVSHADNGNTVESGGGLAVAATIEPKTVCFAAGGWDRADTAEFGGVLLLNVSLFVHRQQG